MNNMLEYQKLDGKLIRLQRECDNLVEKETMNKMISFVKDAQNKSLQLEGASEKLIREYHSLKDEYDKNFEIIQEVIKVDTSTLDSDAVQEHLKKVNSISSQLFMIERNINILITKINERLKEFENTKNNALKARARHKAAREGYDKKVCQLQPEIDKLKAEIGKVESSVNKTLFNRYKTIKNDGIFPVYVPLNDKLCGGCRMELPSNIVNRLNVEEFIVCEHCRRLIYKSK